jgi:hypothetical protein
MLLVLPVLVLASSVRVAPFLASPRAPAAAVCSTPPEAAAAAAAAVATRLRTGG